MTFFIQILVAFYQRLIIMDHGKIIEKGNPADLVKKHVGEEVLEVLYSSESMDFLKRTFSNSRIDVIGDKIQVFPNKDRGFILQVLKESEFKGGLIRDSNLEDVFLKLAGRSLRD